MMAITAQMRVLVCVASVDFRKGIDGLARVCRDVLSADPFSGTMFVFRNRRGTAIKILAYDGQGYWVLLVGGDAEAATGAPVWRRIVKVPES
jgi:hypothetical protein